MNAFLRYGIQISVATTRNRVNRSDRFANEIIVARGIANCMSKSEVGAMSLLLVINVGLFLQAAALSLPGSCLAFVSDILETSGFVLTALSGVLKLSYWIFD